MTAPKVPCAVVGPGNIGTDLMYKLRRSRHLELVAMVGVDPRSEGLSRAAALGIETTADGVDWLLRRSVDLGVRIVFEATSARVHAGHAKAYEEAGLQAIDLTPAAVGPAVVPGVNLDQHLHQPNVNLITCGGQATVPMVAAVARCVDVPYAEIVSTVASRSAGPGTRANIDEFTRTTSRSLQAVGGARRAKAIMILNPAEPPILMRNTVFCGLPDGYDSAAVIESVEATAADVATYVPGYRLKSRPVIEEGPYATPGGPVPARVVILLEVEGAGDFLPSYAGNLDIMNAAAVRVGEAMATRIAGVLR